MSHRKFEGKRIVLTAVKSKAVLGTGVGRGGKNASKKATLLPHIVEQLEKIGVLETVEKPPSVGAVIVSDATGAHHGVDEAVVINDDNSVTPSDEWKNAIVRQLERVRKTFPGAHAVHLFIDNSSLDDKCPVTWVPRTPGMDAREQVVARVQDDLGARVSANGHVATTAGYSAQEVDHIVSVPILSRLCDDSDGLIVSRIKFF